MIWKIEEIKEAISKLSENDYHQLSQWFSEKDWELWDRQIEKDYKAGNLDFLVREALDSKTKLKDL